LTSKEEATICKTHFVVSSPLKKRARFTLSKVLTISDYNNLLRDFFRQKDSGKADCTFGYFFCKKYNLEDDFLGKEKNNVKCSTYILENYVVDISSVISRR
jgi:hypothetical protein